MISRLFLLIALALVSCAPRAVMDTRDFKFSYSLTRPAFVSVDIVSDKKTIRSLVTQRIRTQGLITEVWDGLNDKGELVAGGIYFLHLEADKSSLSRKMLLVR